MRYFTATFRLHAALLFTDNIADFYLGKEAYNRGEPLNKNSSNDFINGYAYAYGEHHYHRNEQSSSNLKLA